MAQGSQSWCQITVGWGRRFLRQLCTGQVQGVLSLCWSARGLGQGLSWSLGGVWPCGQTGSVGCRIVVSCIWYLPPGGWAGLEAPASF